ncbi:MAG: DUF4394 domain-containing protein [Ginsengibacter sp.]
MKKLLTSATISGMALILLLNSCKKGDDYPGNQGGYKNIIFYALAAGMKLDKYNSSRPNSILNSATISGLQAKETILAIDFRPATGQLYGLGSSSRLYVIDPKTGIARMIGAGAFTTPLTGDIAAFDFNPTVDRIRVVTSSGQNLRLNPETSAVAFVDGTINGQTSAVIVAAAYTNNSAGQTTTTLYDIDKTTNSLYIQSPPNDGTLKLVGSLNLNVGEGGFDISPDNSALGIFKVENQSNLIGVDLASGKAKVIAKYNSNLSYNGIAIATNPVAYAVDETNNLIIFNPEGKSSNSYGSSYNNSIDTILKPISGIAAGAKIVGIDFRPLNGQLYALGNNSVVYTLNTSSGAASVAGTLTTTLAGTNFGFDFNPVVDRIRIVSSSGQNLRFNPNDGTQLVDLALNPGMPVVSAVAYSNNFAGTTATMLFAIDATLDKLYVVNPPNDGTLVFQGNLGINAEDNNGFDIGGTSNMGYALFKSGSDTKLYSINTTTGVANQKGSLKSSVINGFTLGLGF